MNIGLFTDTYFPQVSGVATSIKTLKEALEAQGHQVYIFTSTDPKVPKNKFEPHIYRFSSVPYLGFKDRRLAFRGLIQAVEIAKSVQLDIVHTQTEFSLGLLGKFVARQLKIPAVHTYHTMYEDYTHYFAKGMLIGPNGVGRIMKAYMMSMAGVIAPSKLVQDTLVRYGITVPMRIIPTGVSLPKRRSTQVNLRHNYHFYDTQPIILSLGRLAFEKNVAMTISVFSELLQVMPDARLVIAGDGPARKSLFEQVAELELEDKVIFTGMVNHEDIGDYYQMANVFVSSSDTETQGLTFIEAMAANRPFVAIHSPYLDNLVDNEAIGTLVSDYDELLAAVQKYLERPNTLADEQVRQAKMKDVDATKFAERVLAFYQDILADYHADDVDDEYPNDEEVGYMKRILRNPFRRS
ncbi:glycosyltransferase family 4 protein [Leuconostoc falkenbergense]|jgi:1,2-diacylglycerol 3-alpha-glucosyltransferase|uniref:Glycosyltransferase n=1 Tax=Leuconostoc falkenbergense TaxID=2766470 RepID=A0A9X3E6J5_9LACO|nr:MULTISPECIES: glycosyltransferase family 4 protein [Leuconostoc]RDG19302.1 glycosyltransferase family 4 protein [Leuconostoc pseudomesenteroides]MCT4377860.1 glycosyltransferase family 4 protein [Leuconostoc falkenbergense]MCT4389538.1 glycosyltransferase family 4 protein [Leuconostoc falkenbergense]MCT4411645.1 glycosyltransferase family 4 protein [Leuconostoc falkenbergense]MCX7578399.1 glycosyltransferase [Leuconostoc falkenbergense]